MADEAGIEWLRKQIEDDLSRWQKELDWRRSLVVNVPGIGTVVPDYATLITGTADPEDRVADCEAKLAIIEEHPEIIEWNDVVHSAVGRCARCQNWMIAMAAPWPCTTLRQLATAYRHREGYAEHWGDQ